MSQELADLPVALLGGEIAKSQGKSLRAILDGNFTNEGGSGIFEHFLRILQFGTLC